MVATPGPLLSKGRKQCQEELSMGVIWLVVSVAIRALASASCGRGTAARDWILGFVSDQWIAEPGL
jgi:hypothetical protein